jgi:phage terminase large subunit-like protein
VDKLASKCNEAKQSPRKKREFMRYICNRWIAEVEDTWIDPDVWRACGGSVPSHVGEACFAALDLSATRDLSSLCLAFPADDGIDMHWRFWTPADTVKQHEEEWRVPLRDWVEEGWITTSGGLAIDYADIRTAISGVICDSNGAIVDRSDESVVMEHDIVVLVYDPWNAKDLVERQLNDTDGINCEPMRQGYQSMSGPCKEFERMLAAGTIRHGDNPVVSWMARHCVVDQDPAGNIKPNKKKSRHKIDGIVAAVMAIGAMQEHGQVLWTAEDIGL